MREFPVRFLVYREADGEILRTGTCPLPDLELQAGVGERAVESSVGIDDRIHRIGPMGDVVEVRTKAEQEQRERAVLESKNSQRRVRLDEIRTKLAAIESPETREVLAFLLEELYGPSSERRP